MLYLCGDNSIWERRTNGDIISLGAVLFVPQVRTGICASYFVGMVVYCNPMTKFIKLASYLNNLWFFLSIQVIRNDESWMEYVFSCLEK